GAFAFGSIRLVELALRGFTEIEFVVLTAIKGDSAEEVPRHRPDNQCLEKLAERASADGEEDEKEDGIVVRKAVAELTPSAVLIQEIRQERQGDAREDGGVEIARHLRPEEPKVKWGGEPQGKAVLGPAERDAVVEVEDRIPHAALACEAHRPLLGRKRQDRQHYPKVFRQVVVPSDPPDRHPLRPDNGEMLVAESPWIEIAEAGVVRPGTKGEDGQK